MQYIDMTPTWEAVLPVLIAAIENGNFQGKKTAVAELTRMAQLADRYNASTGGPTLAEATKEPVTKDGKPGDFD